MQVTTFAVNYKVIDCFRMAKDTFHLKQHNKTFNIVMSTKFMLDAFFDVKLNKLSLEHCHCKIKITVPQTCQGEMS